MSKDKIICECGNDKFIHRSRSSFCMEGAGGTDHYVCSRCGKKRDVPYKDEPRQAPKSVTLYED